MSTSAASLRWHLSTSAEFGIPHGRLLPIRRSSLWLLLRSGRLDVVGAGALAPGDAILLPRAGRHPATALEDSAVLIAELRADGADAPEDPLHVPGFADRQSGVLALLTRCPVTATLHRERPAVAASYAQLLGAAMMSEAQALTDLRDAPGGPARPGTPGPDPAVRAALRLIERCPAEEWTLPRLAAAAHLGTTALVDRFRRATGSTPGRYLRQVRLDRAMEELRSTDLPVAVIARRTGYGSAESFVRAFRARTGCTPGRWRRASPDEEHHPAGAGAAQEAAGRTLIAAKPTAARAADPAPSAMAAAGPR
ncbi:AraC family transcriptional regulator [Brachybacterium hainanense]|uniref:Helix-turn-helix domain-containing protein n=1 Tax=Brachybacterium hainanense TaxID=1541174 RepID=A0ABV6R741_9MICO